MAEDVEEMLKRFAKKAPRRLAELEGRSGRLAEINMAVRIKEALEGRIRELIHGDAEDLLGEVLGEPHQRPTWREVGEAMGISAQAAHSKYRVRGVGDPESEL
ncbi:hypothetical protein [Nocardiopsis alba]|uniref:hypothetical protein n=1 Tax=Nocardiopsis alba TaxID=53437 RepID=UPI0033DD1AD1